MPDTQYNRLSDTILSALQIAVEQKDVATADILLRALELSLTRLSGGASFTERRTYSPEIEAAISALEKLKSA